MYEHVTFEYILNRALKRVKTDVDKRQGSIIWDALAPACAELAQAYIEFDNILNITFAETSFGEWLEKRCAELGVYRQPGTNAIRLGTMTKSAGDAFDIPIGSRFSIETLNYIAIERLDKGIYKMQCEELGIVGNQLFGKMIPIENIRGLGNAELQEVLIPGEDAESTEIGGALYKRYVEALNTQPYGGNIDDYKQKIKKIDGVGDCKVFPVWNGGGTVKVTLITTEYKPPTDILIEYVQELVDPIPYHQQGKGVAPIGHYTTIGGVSGINIDFKTKLTVKSTLTVGQVQQEIEDIISEYFTNLSKKWADEDNLVVRINQIEALIFNITGVIDVEGTTLNGEASNIVLGSEEIPVLRSVVLDG